jgi:hypothetical protein
MDRRYVLDHDLYSSAPENCTAKWTDLYRNEYALIYLYRIGMNLCPRLVAHVQPARWVQ